MTPTAWRRTAIPALIIVLTGALIGWSMVAGLSWLIWSIFHRSFRESNVLACVVLFGTGLLLLALLILGSVPRYLRDFRAGGRVLLDCGPFPGRALLFGGSAFWAVLGITVLTAFPWSKPFSVDSLVTGAVSAFFFLFALFFLTGALGRLQIREDGLWRYCALIRWEKIDSLRLTDDSTLLIHVKTYPWFLGHSAIPIPPEKKDALTELLNKKQCLAWDRDF
jgi:hypothetical protein